MPLTNVGKGRPKGSRNKLNALNFKAEEVCRENNFDPLRKMIQMAETTKSATIRARMYESIAKYVYPQRRAHEHSGPDGGPIVHTVNPVESLLSRVSKLATTAPTPGSIGGDAKQ